MMNKAEQWGKALRQIEYSVKLSLAAKQCDRMRLWGIPIRHLNIFGCGLGVSAFLALQLVLLQELSHSLVKHQLVLFFMPMQLEHGGWKR